MKQMKWLAVIAMVATCMISCEQKESTVVDSSLIFGLWQEQNDKGQLEREYMRFLTAEQEAKEGDYFFGREWDEDDDVKESDLKYKGNGWFKWKIDGSSMIQIELMDNGGAEIPKTYNVTKLTSTEMVLQDPYDKNDVDTWIRG